MYSLLSTLKKHHPPPGAQLSVSHKRTEGAFSPTTDVPSNPTIPQLTFQDPSHPTTPWSIFKDPSNTTQDNHDMVDLQRPFQYNHHTVNI